MMGTGGSAEDFSSDNTMRLSGLSQNAEF